MFKKVNTFLLLVVIIFTLTSQKCEEDCKINPDLISDLLAPASDIIAGEPVDWDYTVRSAEENSDGCDILEAIASVGNIVIDFFFNETDTNGELVFNDIHNINPLTAGQSQTAPNTIDVFNNTGIYLVSVNADHTDVVEERNEENNKDNGEVEFRVADDIFQNASDEFKEKLEGASAIVIVGDLFNGKQFSSYKGKPVYFAK